jgi:hypothetical protein
MSWIYEILRLNHHNLTNTLCCVAILVCSISRISPSSTNLSIQANPTHESSASRP